MTLTLLIDWTHKIDVQVAQVAKLTVPLCVWPWPNDLGTQNWPGCGQDVPSYQKWSFYVISWREKFIRRCRILLNHKRYDIPEIAQGGIVRSTEFYVTEIPTFSGTGLFINL